VFTPVREAGEHLLHVFLDLPLDALRARIDADEKDDAGARSFRLRNAPRATAALAALPADTLVLRSDLHTPEQLADLVLTFAAPGPTRDHPDPPG